MLHYQSCADARAEPRSWRSFRASDDAGGGLGNRRADPQRYTALVKIRADGRTTAEELPDGLAALLATAATPQPRAALVAHAASLGLDASDADVLLDELVAAGTLVPSG